MTPISRFKHGRTEPAPETNGCRVQRCRAVRRERHPTFRDSNGLWENHRVEDVASPGGWRRDPALVLRFYELRFRGVQTTQPNEAHRSIAGLQAKFNVLNITQNIDDLLERAGCENVVHLHGLITRRKCEFHHDIFQ